GGAPGPRGCPARPAGHSARAPPPPARPRGGADSPAAPDGPGLGRGGPPGGGRRPGAAGGWLEGPGDGPPLPGRGPHPGGRRGAPPLPLRHGAGADPGAAPDARALGRGGSPADGGGPGADGGGAADPGHGRRLPVGGPARGGYSNARATTRCIHPSTAPPGY